MSIRDEPLSSRLPSFLWPSSWASMSPIADVVTLVVGWIVPVGSIYAMPPQSTVCTTTVFCCDSTGRYPT